MYHLSNFFILESVCSLPYHINFLPTNYFIEFNQYSLSLKPIFNDSDYLELVNIIDKIQISNKKFVDVNDMLFNNVLDKKTNLSFNVLNESDYNHFENIKSIYHASIPTNKLLYPEPYIASPSYMHVDLSFLHIFQYQFWLWFVFVFLIVFFFITFVSVIRWCNLRTQPRRETRGVSRSKCGDLITACVPVSWATSIIVSETTDALDYYDGFGTSEIIIGVRAYQWGWEYYYPKDIDLNYNIKPNYSAFIGNSVKYVNSSEKKLNVNNVWRFYQNKNTDEVLTPAHLLILPLDNNNLINFLNFDEIGSSPLKDSSAFKKIRTNSKTFTSNLTYVPTSMNNLYLTLNKFHENENNLQNTLNYGLKKQHTLTSINTTSNNFSSFLDRKSLNKFLNYNLNYNQLQEVDKSINNPNTLNRATSDNFLNYSTVSLTNKLNNSQFLQKQDISNLFISNTGKLDLINNDSDKKSLNFPHRKLFNKSTLDSSQVLNNYTIKPQLNLIKQYYGSKNFYNFSPTSTILSAKQATRLYNNSLNYSNYNYNSNNLTNKIQDLLHSQTLRSTNNLNTYYIHNKLNYVNENSFLRFNSNRFFFESPYMPIVSNLPTIEGKDYDNTSSYKFSTVPTKFGFNEVLHKLNGADVGILQGSREGALKTLTTVYWDMFWANSNLNLRTKTAISSSLGDLYNYIPLFTSYADYDFRNAQALELLEDAFWETSYSGYNHFDYLNIMDKSYLKNSFTNNVNKVELKFLKNHTGSNNQIVLDTSVLGKTYTNALQGDDFIINSTNLNKDCFSIFNQFVSTAVIDESYLTHKHFLNLSQNFTNSLKINNLSKFPMTQSYLNVLNTFRADFDDFSVVNTKPSFKVYNISSSVGDLGAVKDENNFLPNNRLTNFLSLRSTARNSIVTYNALQKVFKTRFDEGRSLTSFNYFSNLYTKQPFLTAQKVNYESLLGKNKNNYYNNLYYNNFTNKFLNFFTNPVNSYFYEFPFLAAFTNDPSRYLWFDWYVRWGLYEVQPAAVSKYSTLGVPYSKKHFDFNIETGEKINDNDSYLIRIARARKNYLNTWMYTPYLAARNLDWKNQSYFINQFNTDKLSNTELLINKLLFLKDNNFILNNYSKTFLPSNSLQNLYLKSAWRPFNGVQSYYYNLNNLTDILTKREYMYRNFFEKNNNILNIPAVFTNNPRNPLLNEIKSSFLLIDPITYNTEASREIFYESANFFKYLLIKDTALDVLKSCQLLPVNWSLFTNYLYFYFSDTRLRTDHNEDLYKNQYRPLRKGINSMLRLHATGAIAMPIEIRLQILASSRDVIHSWAIPSAGIKIDCIPGYTSHRIMIFLLSGIYWGQCMEICGRYHHWMPIVVYFMKRDLFFLWCTHFVYKTGVNDLWDINDRAYTDYVRLVSYDKNAWLSELSLTL